MREIYETLRAICVASRDNKPIGDKMIMNAAFLLEREREAEFDAAVNRIAKKFGDRLNFKYTGPWPPYNFVNIRLKLEPSRYCKLNEGRMHVAHSTICCCHPSRDSISSCAPWRGRPKSNTPTTLPSRSDYWSCRPSWKKARSAKKNTSSRSAQFWPNCGEIQNRRMQMAGITPEEAERMGRPMLEIPRERAASERRVRGTKPDLEWTGKKQSLAALRD